MDNSNSSGTAINPVWDDNFPDPQIIVVDDGSYLAIATNAAPHNVPTLISKDLRTWERGPDAMPQLPAWTTGGKQWAPEAMKFGDQWVLYYTTPGPDPSLQSVGCAVASAPQGPYVDSNSGPLVFETETGGSIDASPYIDADGKAWLMWKNDGNAVGLDTWISIQALSADGTKLEGEPKQLIKQDQAWEGNLVEGPVLWHHNNTYYLFYSANNYGSDRYAVGVATASAVTGPYTKYSDPIMVTNEVAAGPGHCNLFQVGEQLWMVYHAWNPDSIGSTSPGRTMWLSGVHFAADGTVSVDPPAFMPATPLPT